MSETVVLAVVSDLHTNSTIGLCPPYVELDDGGALPQQQSTALVVAQLEAYVDKVEGRRPNARTAVSSPCSTATLNDGDHHDTPQIISRNEATQLKIAVEASEAAGRTIR